MRTKIYHFLHSHQILKLVQPEEDENNSSAGVANLPTNENVATKVRQEIDNQISVHINKIFDVVWVDGSGQYNWFLEYVSDEQQDVYLVSFAPG